MIPFEKVEQRKKGRPRRIRNAVYITLYMDKDIVRILDEKLGEGNRGSYIRAAVATSLRRRGWIE